jgi:hypothetical protein
MGNKISEELTPTTEITTGRKAGQGKKVFYRWKGIKLCQN